MSRRPVMKPAPKLKPPKRVTRPAFKPQPRVLHKQHRGGR